MSFNPIYRLICLVVFFSSPMLYANSKPLNAGCIVQMLEFTNLHGTDFAKKSAMTEDIESLLASAKGDDAYTISMPLLVSARLGDSALYSKSLAAMQSAMQSKKLIPSDQNSFKAWMYGRILLAADSIDDSETVSKTLIDLNVLLHDKETADDAFDAWAVGYLAALNDVEYNDYKDVLKKSSEALTKTAVQANHKNSTMPADKKQAARSDAIWAWIMVLQAAANVSDTSMYNHALSQLKVVAQQNTVADALSKGLLRSSASNDYSAWALAIARLAAITIGDTKLFADLDAPTTAAITAAEQANAKAEVLLAQVNNQLALEREKILKGC